MSYAIAKTEAAAFAERITGLGFPVYMARIYARERGSAKRWMALDLTEGCMVHNLIHASLIRAHLR